MCSSENAHTVFEAVWQRKVVGRSSLGGAPVGGKGWPANRLAFLFYRFAWSRFMSGHNNAFPRSARLLQATDYSRVFKSCERRAGSKHLLLLTVANNSHSRLGLVIAKKHVKQANQRNRVKRVIREYFRLHPVTHPTDFVVLARPGLATLSNQEIRDALAALWQKIDGANPRA